MNLFGLQISLGKAGPPATVPAPVMNGAASVFGFIRESFAGAWQRNIEVDSRESVLAFAAVYACVRRISSDIAKLPIDLVEEQDDGTWPVVQINSPFLPVLAKPNRYQTRIQFIADWIIAKLLYGNAYILKERDARGIVIALYPLMPLRVTPLVGIDGSVWYRLGQDLLAGVEDQYIVPASEIIHDKDVTLFHPLIGISPIYACGSSATQGNRIQANSAKFFENMSRPSGMLTAPGTIKEDTAARLKKHWEENFSGSNLGRLAVLGDGLTYAPMTIPPQDAQLIQQLGWTVDDVARAFGVPLYKINAGTMPTHTSVEALDLQYYTGCLQVLMQSLELCLDEGLSLPPRYDVRFNLDNLLRMDSATRFIGYQQAINAGWMKPNEARLRENLAPVPGGGTPYLQVQNYSLAALARRDQLAEQGAPGPANAPSDPTAAPTPDATPVLPAAPNPGAGQAAAEAAAAAKAMDAECVVAVAEVMRGLLLPDDEEHHEHV